MGLKPPSFPNSAPKTPETSLRRALLSLRGLRGSTRGRRARLPRTYPETELSVTCANVRFTMIRLRSESPLSYFSSLFLVSFVLEIVA